jgi:hypothetical protein
MSAVQAAAMSEWTDDERYAIADAFFPTAASLVNYKAFLDWTFRGATDTA